MGQPVIEKSMPGLSLDQAVSKEIIIAPSLGLQPAALFTPTPKAAQRVLEFFTAQINNDNTRKAYLNATRRFAEWCDHHGISQLANVKPFHVAAFVKELQGESSRRLRSSSTSPRSACSSTGL
jgi:hypothetical protein